ncbi:hypothetical protein ACE6H2_023571 [Prunus campanulata]
MAHALVVRGILEFSRWSALCLSFICKAEEEGLHLLVSEIQTNHSRTEFQEAIMKLMIHKAKENEWAFQTPDRVTEISSPSNQAQMEAFPQAQATKEFICPVFGSLMADPVIISSGHTFERACVQVCKALNFTPTLVDSSPPDFSSIISNLALKFAILNWCHKSSINPPKPLDFSSADQLVRAFMASQNQTQPQKLVILENELLIQGVNETPKVNFNHAATEVTRRLTHFHSSSDESVTAPVLLLFPFVFLLRN